MGKKILKNFKKSDALKQKNYLDFNLKCVLGQGYPLSSDFIFNIQKYDKSNFEKSMFYFLIRGVNNFKIFNKIIDEAGQELFSNNVPSDNIPDYILKPPVTISSYKFTGELGPIQKNLMTMLSFHSPYNVTLDTMVPLAYFFNNVLVSANWKRTILFMSRIPIYVQLDNMTVLTCFRYLFGDGVVFLNSFFRFHDDAIFNRNRDSWNAFRNFCINFNNLYINDVRQHNNVDSENIVYNVQYNDGRFYGDTGPLANDWYYTADSSLKSDYNTVSFIKCIFDICCLGSCFNDGNNYTLNNAAVFCSFKQGNFKFCGKYSMKRNADSNSTSSICQSFYNKIMSDQLIKDEIIRNSGFNFPAFGTIYQMYNYGSESINHAVFPLADLAVKSFFKGVFGLENYIRSCFGLFISGLFGHLFDYVLRYFDLDHINTMDQEVVDFRIAHSDFNFVQHIGSLLGSYFFDYKTLPEKNILIGYNLNYLSKCLQYNILSVADNVRYNTTYYASNKNIGLFPIIYQNIDFYVKIRCYRSFKYLLSLMNTRSKRQQVFASLNQYGRRCFTVLDPYGIFLYFHDSSGGIKPIENK